ncbi:aminodeoxychorismate lyase [Mycobacterium sp. MYCO198283]|uniref:aminodeoxychorismate lyase n=1 Tax=Mycobacterium sp. MYCO198283 TaxID=2883505 RepID=UPI001E4F3E0E|nr:aminodeoxychorismate lyase [Mycobacterium sp. MYCO198283]MCG5431288.1 aminodeoxychorismate lyase [Mycobacterium sp. MYCO198283]
MVVTADGESCDPSAPLLHADDLAAVRGDGVFETLLVRDGRPCRLDAHLHRLGRSADQLELPAPDLDAWRRAALLAADRWARCDDGDGALRLVYSRGRESGGPPTAYLTVAAVPERVHAVRRDGLAALTLDRGLATSASDAPWLLAGAKTLSYAVNMAALRYGAARGAGDVVFVSSDGYVLEGPRSTVVIALGETLVTPPPTQPILHGTTQRALFDVATAAGHPCEYRPLRVADLVAAEGVWLVSSITLQARVHTLDGEPLRPAPLTPRFAELVDAAVAGA